MSNISEIVEKQKIFFAVCASEKDVENLKKELNAHYGKMHVISEKPKFFEYEGVKAFCVKYAVFK